MYPRLKSGDESLKSHLRQLPKCHYEERNDELIAPGMHGPVLEVSRHAVDSFRSVPAVPQGPFLSITTLLKLYPHYLFQTPILKMLQDAGTRILL